MAHLVWPRFGNPVNTVDPCAGSCAIHLERPHAPQIETFNDKDCYLANFWRAVQADPDAVAYWADWPVFEADLHARHKWLTNNEAFRERMLSDPDYFDAKVAGWWVWGICLWIGSGWCVKPEWRGRSGVERSAKGMHAAGIGDWRPHRKPPNTHVKGCLGDVDRELPRTMPGISGEGGATGRGIHASGFEEKTGGIREYFTALAERLAKVRICCGDWRRVLGPSATYKIGLTAVFLDPPYEDSTRHKRLYRVDSADISTAMREWAIENGDNPLMRIALCGYEGEHQMPANWRKLAWHANGGYANQTNKGSRGRSNAKRERIWFSPHCLDPEEEFHIFREAEKPEDALVTTGG